MAAKSKITGTSQNIIAQTAIKQIVTQTNYKENEFCVFVVHHMLECKLRKAEMINAHITRQIKISDWKTSKVKQNAKVIFLHQDKNK